MKRIKEKVTERYMQEFVAENIELIPSYKLPDIYSMLICYRFKEDYPDFYLETRYDDYFIENIGFKIENSPSYPEIVKAFEKFIEGQSGGKEEAKLKQALTYACSKFRYDGDGLLYEYRSYGMTSIDSLLYILNWVIYDELLKDYGDVNDWLKSHGIEHSTLMFRDTFPELENIEITAQKNGKIKIKGLDRDDLDRLSYIFNLCERK